MQSESDWINQDDAASYKYYTRVDPNQRQFMGPIEVKFDPIFNTEVRQRAAKIGMVRGAKPENMKDVTVFLDPLPHVRMEHSADLRGWYSGKTDGDDWRQRDRPCMTDAILSTPYSGTCPVCPSSFCYINSSQRGYRGSGLTTVPMGYGDHVRKNLRSMRSAQAGYFSSFTDPFMPLEQTYHNTQNGSQAFVDEGLPVFFLSRLSYPDWTYDMLRKSPFSYAQKSINTPHEDDWRRLSARALPLEDHFQEIRKLHEAGIYVSIQVNPVIAGIVTHEDIELLFGKLAEVGTDHVIVKFVEANHPWVPNMVENFTKRFGDNRAAAFRELFTEKQAGAQTTIVEEYRREGHARYQRRATELGMTYSTCYEYSKKNGRWVSLGPEYMTSKQCHGRAVPFHVRPAPGEPFRPLDECPPSGCLSCADDNGGKARCGSELLGKALALTLKDLRADPGITTPGFTPPPAGATIVP